MRHTQTFDDAQIFVIPVPQSATMPATMPCPPRCLHAWWHAPYLSITRHVRVFFRPLVDLLLYKSNNLYLISTWQIFKFVDDFEIQFEGDGLVCARSASRTGSSDLGVNTMRIGYLVKALKARGWKVN